MCLYSIKCICSCNIKNFPKKQFQARDNRATSLFEKSKHSHAYGLQWDSIKYIAMSSENPSTLYRMPSTAVKKSALSLCKLSLHYSNVNDDIDMLLTNWSSVSYRQDFIQLL